MRKGSETLRKLAQWIPQAAVRPFGRPVVLFFHGVAPRIADPRIEINHHTTESFHSIAVQLKRHFNILPLDALADALIRPERHAHTVFLMSDDGYANTMLAADILEDLHIPWTLFVSSRHIETGELNPLILARLFVYYAPEGRYHIPHLSQPIALASADMRDTVAAPVLQHLKRLPAGEAREAIAAMTSAFPPARLAQLRTMFESERYLTWNEVRALHGRGVEIGAHAHWHWPMNEYQSAYELRMQAERPRQAIVLQVGSCRYFSYPFGNFGDVSNTAWQAVREAGYSNAFTTLSGTLGRTRNPWLLPRYALRTDERHLPALLPMLRIADRRLARLTAGAAPALTVSQ